MEGHPLLHNPWSNDADPELGLVALAHIRGIDRAQEAIQAMARLVGNSVREPAASGAAPLDAWTASALMGGIECLCEHTAHLTDAMLAQARDSGAQVDG